MCVYLVFTVIENKKCKVGFEVLDFEKKKKIQKLRHFCPKKNFKIKFVSPGV